MENSRKSRLSEMLRKRPKDFAEREKKVYDYLLKRESRIQDLKVSDIAEGAGVSKATVVRFCKTLGYDGLKDFKVGYEAGKGPAHLDVEELDFDTPSDEIGQRYVSLLNSVFHASFSTVNQTELLRIAESIMSAESVRIIAEGDAVESAAHAYSVLKNCIPSIKIVGAEELRKLPPSGLTLAFSYGTSENVAAYMKKADLLGYQCILFSSDSRSKISSYATHTVTAAKSCGLMARNSVMSKLVIDAFINEVYAFIVVMKGHDDESFRESF